LATRPNPGVSHFPDFARTACAARLPRDHPGTACQDLWAKRDPALCDQHRRSEKAHPRRFHCRRASRLPRTSGAALSHLRAQDPPRIPEPAPLERRVRPLGVKKSDPSATRSIVLLAGLPCWSVSAGPPRMNRLPTEELFCATVGVGSLAAGEAAGFVADARHDTGVKITERFGYGAIIGDDEQRRAAWNRTLH